MASQTTAGNPDRPHLNVRRACEECHNRKIRCQIASEGSACTYCQSNNRVCFFLPQNKAGRPKVGSGGGRGSKSAANINALSAAVSAAIESNKNAMNDHSTEDVSFAQLSARSTPRQNPGQVPVASPLQPDTNGYRNHDPLGAAFDMAFPDYNPSANTDFDAFPMYDMDANMLFTTGDHNINNNLPHAQQNPNLALAGADWGIAMQGNVQLSSPAATAPGSPASEASNSSRPVQHYQNLLDIMGRLQKSHDAIRSRCSQSYSSHCFKAQVEAVLKIIDESCAASCEVLTSCSVQPESMSNVGFTTGYPNPTTSGRSSGYRSLLALAVAMILKVVEVCEVIVEWGLMTGGNDSLHSLLFVKRMEVHGVQARIALAGVQRLDSAFHCLVEDTRSKLDRLQEKFAPFRSDTYG